MIIPTYTKTRTCNTHAHAHTHTHTHARARARGRAGRAPHTHSHARARTHTQGLCESGFMVHRDKTLYTLHPAAHLAIHCNTQGIYTVKRGFPTMQHKLHCNTLYYTHCNTQCNKEGPSACNKRKLLHIATHSTHCNTHWNALCNSRCLTHSKTHCNTLQQATRAYSKKGADLGATKTSFYTHSLLLHTLTASTHTHWSRLLLHTHSGVDCDKICMPTVQMVLICVPKETASTHCNTQHKLQHTPHYTSQHTLQHTLQHNATRYVCVQ